MEVKKFTQFIAEKRGGTRQIFCDMDGVLVDFNRGFKRLKANTEKLTPDAYQKKHGDNSIWPLIDEAGVSFWENLPWMKDGRELWDYLSQYDPIILSSPSRNRSSITGKMAWARKNLGISQDKPTTSSKNWDPSSKIILSSQKQLFARSKDDILIDDTRKKLDKWTAAGGTGVFHNDATDTIRVIEEIILRKD
jgi:hypothetical protein